MKPPVTAMLGYENDAYHQRLSTTSRFDGLIAHPGAAGVCIVYAVGRIFRSEDAGARFADFEPRLHRGELRGAADQARRRSGEPRPLRDRLAGRQPVHLHRPRPLGPHGAGAGQRLHRAARRQRQPKRPSALELRHRHPAERAHRAQHRQLRDPGAGLDRRRRPQLPGDPVGAGRRLQLHRLPSDGDERGGRRGSPLDRRRRHLPHGARLRGAGPVGRRRALRALGQQPDHALGQLGDRHAELDRVLRQPGVDPEIRPEQPPDGDRPPRRVHRLDGRRDRRPDPGAQHRRDGGGRRR